jgi:hypothetical protein
MIIILTGSPYLSPRLPQLTDRLDSENPSFRRPDLSNARSRLLIEPLESVGLSAAASEMEALGPGLELSDAD